MAKGLSSSSANRLSYFHSLLCCVKNETAIDVILSRPTTHLFLVFPLLGSRRRVEPVCAAPTVGATTFYCISKVGSQAQSCGIMAGSKTKVCCALTLLIIIIVCLAVFVRRKCPDCFPHAAVAADSERCSLIGR